jgi:undecaprenyl diphosphate synthase
MDGNGRWAQARGQSRSQGHLAGAEPVRTILKAAHKIGVRYLTLYAFSTENWARSAEEVGNLFDLLERYLDSETAELFASGVRLQAAGDLARLPEAVQKALAGASEMTARNTDLTLTLALSYGSRAELTAAAKSLARQAKAGSLDPETIDEELLTRQMWTKDLPEVDLLIRTGGDERISNFLLWHLAYAELYFTDTLWPDFGEADFLAAVSDFQGRQRRFGRVQPGKEQS